MSVTNNRIAVFIDSGNLWSSYRSMGKLIDMKMLSPFFEKKFESEIFKIFYYEAFPSDGARSKEDIDKKHKFFTFLKKGLKFVIVKKELKTIYQRNAQGELVYDQKTGKPQSIEKGNFDVEITIDAIRYSSAYDIGIFMGGDSDFLPLITYLRNLNKKIYVFSTEGSVSKELRTGADGYFDISDYEELYGTELKNKE